MMELENATVQMDVNPALQVMVTSDEPNEITSAAMAAAERDEDMYGPFDSVADLMEALNA